METLDRKELILHHDGMTMLDKLGQKHRGRVACLFAIPVLCEQGAL